MSGTDNALRLWQHIFGDDPGILQVFTGVRGEDGKLHDTRSTNFYYPKNADDAAGWALEMSEEGYEVYFCTHLLTGPQRRKENAAPVLALWCELDGAPVPNSDLTPTAVVESSPGHFHPFWRLGEAIPPGDAELLNKRLARAVGADPSGFDLTQLLRVPGTVNCKYPERPAVRLLSVDEDRTYVPHELADRLPQVEEPEPEPEPDGDEPPVRLDPYYMRM